MPYRLTGLIIVRLICRKYALRFAKIARRELYRVRHRARFAAMFGFHSKSEAELVIFALFIAPLIVRCEMNSEGRAWWSSCAWWRLPATTSSIHYPPCFDVHLKWEIISRASVWREIQILILIIRPSAACYQWHAVIKYLSSPHRLAIVAGHRQAAVAAEFRNQAHRENRVSGARHHQTRYCRYASAKPSSISAGFASSVADNRRR